MFSRKLTQHKVEFYLSGPIRKWFIRPPIDPPLNGDLVKKSLQSLLRRAQRIFPRSQIAPINICDRPLHDCDANYLWHLMRLDEHLENKRWFEACDLLSDMLHYYHVEERRILGTIISVLEAHL